MGDWNATVPTFAVGNLATADMTTLADIDTALTAPWTDWSPTLTNLTLGNGGVTARYRRLGHTVDWRFKFTLGSTSAVGTGPTFTLPVNPHADYVGSQQGLPLGSGWIVDFGITARPATVYCASASTGGIWYTNATPAPDTGITATAPWTWGTSDSINIVGCYEAA